MVKRTITITTILLVLSIVVCLIIALNRASFAADDDIASGTSGTCSWVIDKDGVLTISPTDGVSGVLERTYSFNYPKWYQYRESITKVIVNSGVKTDTHCSKLFYQMTNCTEVNLSNLDTSNATDMREMFRECSKLTSLDLTGFDTSNVSDMSYLFDGCKNLKNINITRFDTSNVTSMKNMFFSCDNLITLDLTNFNTSKVTNMENLFSNCYSLTTLDVSSFDTSNVTNMFGMFNNCNNLTQLNLSNFDTSNVKMMGRMFSECSSLETIDLSNFNTSSCSDNFAFCYMFESCSNLRRLEISNFDTHGGTDFSGLFRNCEKLEQINVKDWDVSNVTNFFDVFDNCKSLVNLDLSGWETTNANSMPSMFRECTSLETIDLSNFDTRNVNNFNGIFVNDINLSEIKVGKNFDPIAKTTRRVDTLDLKVNYSTLEYADYWSREDNAYGPFLDEEWADLFDRETMYGVWKRTRKYYTCSVEYYYETLKAGQYELGNKEEIEISDVELLNIDDYNYEIYGFNYEDYAKDWQTDTLKLYYKRNSYNVTYSYVGEIPDNVSTIPKKQTYKYEEKIKLPNKAIAPGYTFSGWITDYITMPGEDIEITGYFIKEDDSKEYKIEYYFDGEKDEKLTEKMNAEKDKEVSIDPQRILKHNNTYYTLVSKEHKIIISENAEDNVIRVYYKTFLINTNNSSTTRNRREEIISKIRGKASNPKTDDVVQSYALYGAIAILLMLVVKRTINKYSRKKKKIQF